MEVPRLKLVEGVGVPKLVFAAPANKPPMVPVLGVLPNRVPPGVLPSPPAPVVVPKGALRPKPVPAAWKGVEESPVPVPGRKTQTYTIPRRTEESYTQYCQP